MAGENQLVSVVIPTYNYAHFLGDAIESALAQAYKNIEVIVVDDGSSDNTSDVVKKYEGAVRYIYQNNRGLSAARNTGIRESRGQYIAFLDADDIWMPEKISEQLKLFEGQNNIGAVSCRFYEMNERMIVLAESKHKDYPPKVLKEKLMLSNAVSGGSSIVVKKECFDLVGLFDEKLSAAEDWDMWLRISTKFNIRIVEKPLLKVRVGNYSMSSSENAQKMLDNELVVLNKYFGNGVQWQKCRSLSGRYLSAAWAFKEYQRKNEALKCIFLSYAVFPLNLFSKRHLGLFLKIVLSSGRK
jgi:glycosyltransferase involved in cell wall biosynthesis